MTTPTPAERAALKAARRRLYERPTDRTDWDDAIDLVLPVGRPAD